MNTSTLFSSARDDWATPQSLFDELHAEFDFTLDAAAAPHNAKCARYFTKSHDALQQTWTGRVWLNPPYNEPEQPCKRNCRKKRCQERGYHVDTYQPGTIDFIRKAYESVFVDRTAELVVVLPAARTDVQWFHRYVWDKHNHRPRPGVETRFIEGRLKFDDGGSSAPFPSVIIVMKRGDS